MNEEAEHYNFNPFTGRRETGYNFKADDRLVSRTIPCAYCRHQLNIANPYRPSLNSTCKAFPTGIPWQIQEGKWNHDHVVADQEGSYIYESKQAASFPDGYNYVTFDGKWVRCEDL